MPTMKAVQFDHFGEVDVLNVVALERPEAEPGTVVVQVRAAGINPGESMIRKGALEAIYPTTFPCGEGTDFAGVVHAVGDGVQGVKQGDEVLGYSHDRSSHADYVRVPANQVTRKPAQVSFDVAGALNVAGTTAVAAVRSVGLQPGDVVAVSAAAGGVGTIAVQLAVLAGATVLGIAGDDNAEWLKAHGVIPVSYGDELADRLKQASPTGKVDAFLDLFGKGYVELAIHELGIDPQRIDTVIDFAAGPKFGIKVEGAAAATGTDTLDYLTGLIAEGKLEVPIAANFPLADVRGAFTELEKRHTRGKIVLHP